MRFEQHFEVDGEPYQVIRLFEDVPLMASLLPGASVGPRQHDGTYPAQLAVAFGAKRIVFRGHLTPTIDLEGLRGTLVGHASTDLRGAKMSVAMDYALMPEQGGTRVVLVSQAELTGMLAEFARSGGEVVTEALLSQFAQGLSAHLRDAQGPKIAIAAPAPAAPLSGFTLLGRMLRTALGAVARGLRRLVRH